jgi:hypothetical protein
MASAMNSALRHHLDAFEKFLKENFSLPDDYYCPIT